MQAPMPYAKLAVGTGRDDKIGLALEAGNNACGLFLLSIPEAYPYGILPGNPRKFRACVAAAAMIPDDEIQDAIDTLVELDLMHRYEADGEALLYIRNYHQYQDVKWFKVRPSEYPLPDCWVPPVKLQEFIDTGSLASANKTLALYGIVGLPNKQEIAEGEQQGSTGGAAGEQGGSRGGAGGEQGGSLTVEGSSICINDNDSAREENEDDERPRPHSQRLGETGDLPYLKREYGNLWAACKDLPWPHGIGERWLSDIVAAMRSPSDTWIADDDFAAAELLRDNPPKGSDKNLPSKWLERMEQEAPAPAHVKRDAAMLEWQAEIEREDEERRKLEEAEATS